MNFGSIFGNALSEAALVGQALAATAQLQVALRDGVLTEDELAGVVNPIVATISSLVKHTLPSELVYKIEAVVAEVVTDYYLKK